jgi:hypothetical protein
MSASRHTRVLIIGSGPAGYTAAVYSARAMLSPLLIQGLQPGGQLTITTEVENWPGDHSVLGPNLMVRMEEHARAMGAEVISDYITSLDLSKRPFTAHAGRRRGGWGCPARSISRASASRPVRPATGSSIGARKWSWSGAATRRWKRRCS